jgi:imidazolonepropionase-like amidohydrolase
MRQLLTADLMLDGTGGVTEGAAVLVDGNRIIAAGRAADIGRPEGAEVVALPPGTTLMPGLIDSHVHVAYSGDHRPEAIRRERMDLSYPALALNALSHAQASLAHGVTALRDMAAPGGVAIDLRNAIAAGRFTGPRIRACGRGLTVTGGHMDPPGLADHVSTGDFFLPCDGADAFRRGARQELKRGADFVKINACVGRRDRPGVWWRPEMTSEEMIAARSEAEMQGTITAAHTSGGPPLTETVRMGVHCVEHAHWIDDDCIELMARQGTWLVPTLTVNERTFDLAEAGAATPSEWSRASREAKWISLEKARKAGIRVGAGTDAGFMLPHGTMHWRELQLLVQGGYSELEAITAATSVNAEILGIDAGRLAPGRLADLLAVEGDPRTGIDALSDPARLTVWLGGRLVARAGQLMPAPGAAP